MSNLVIPLGWFAYAAVGLMIHADSVWAAGMIIGNVWAAAYYVRSALQHREPQHD